MKFNADTLKALAEKIIAKRKSDEASMARKREDTLREYAKAIEAQLPAVRAVAPAVQALKSHGIGFVEDYFVGWVNDFRWKGDNRIAFSDDCGRIGCVGEDPDAITVFVDVDTGKYQVAGQRGELTIDEVVDKCRGYNSTLVDRFRRLAEDLSEFAGGIADRIAKIAG